MESLLRDTIWGEGGKFRYFMLYFPNKRRISSQDSLKGRGALKKPSEEIKSTAISDVHSLKLDQNNIAFC